MLTDDQLKQNHDLTLELFDAFKRICDENDITYFVAEGTAIGTVREKGFIPWDTNMDINLVVDQFDRLDEIMKTQVPEGMMWGKTSLRMINRLTFLDPSKSTDLHPCPNIDINILAPVSNNPILRYIQLLIIHYGYEAFRLRQTQVKRKFPYNALKIIASILPTSVYFKAQKYFLYLYDLEKSKYLISIAPGGHLHKGDIVKKRWFDPQKQVWGIFEGRKVRLPADCDKYLRNYYGDYMTPVKAEKGKNRSATGKLT